jgi:hypothetical protein
MNPLVDNIGYLPGGDCSAVDSTGFQELGDIGPAPPDAPLSYYVEYGPDPSEPELRLFIACSASLPKLPPPDSLRTPAKAAPKKLAAKDINKLVEQIRSDQPPELPKHKREQHYRDPALPNLYIRLFNTGVASWVVQYKQFGRQKKVRLGDVKVLDRLGEEGAIKAAKDLLAKVQLGRLDPQKAKRERMRANKVTFGTVAPLFISDKKRQGVRSGTIRYWDRFLTGYYFKPLHSLPIDGSLKSRSKSVSMTLSFNLDLYQRANA